jgi:hypothetical protein
MKTQSVGTRGPDNQHTVVIVDVFAPSAVQDVRTICPFWHMWFPSTHAGSISWHTTSSRLFLSSFSTAHLSKNFSPFTPSYRGQPARVSPAQAHTHRVIHLSPSPSITPTICSSSLHSPPAPPHPLPAIHLSVLFASHLSLTHLIIRPLAPAPHSQPLCSTPHARSICFKIWAISFPLLAG